MEPPRRRQWTLKLAVVIGVAITIPFLTAGVMWIVESVRGEALSLEARQILVRAGVPARTTEAGVLAAVAGTVALTGSLLAVIALAGTWLRRRWGRDGTLGLFGVYALIMIPLSIAGMAADPPGENAGWGLLIGLLSAVVAGLMLAPPTILDFERAELARHHPTMPVS